jgi:hypothetical protein
VYGQVTLNITVKWEVMSYGSEGRSSEINSCWPSPAHLSSSGSRFRETYDLILLFHDSGSCEPRSLVGDIALHIYYSHIVKYIQKIPCNLVSSTKCTFESRFRELYLDIVRKR